MKSEHLASRLLALLLAALLLSLPGCASRSSSPETGTDASSLSTSDTIDAQALGADFHSGSGKSLGELLEVAGYSETGHYYTLDERPNFADLAQAADGYESYSELDELGRCGPAVAKIGFETMPTEGRGDISKVKPTGWRQGSYPELIKASNGALYNRCHLIAFSLAGENANRQNLITGTRQMNEAMIAFEDIVRVYVNATGNHVFYRVTPIFEGDELVARGVWMEALSVEDGGEGVNYSVYLPNSQDGVTIDYATGDNLAN